MIFKGKFIGNGFFIESEVDVITDFHKGTVVRATNGLITIICELNRRDSHVVKILDVQDKPCLYNHYLLDEEDEFSKWLANNLNEIKDIYKYKVIRVKKYFYLPLCKKGHRLLLIRNGDAFIELPKNKVYKLLRKFKKM